MKYLEAKFTLSPSTEMNGDILKALAGDAGFESFTDIPGGFLAYIQEKDYNSHNVEDALHAFPLEFTYTYSVTPAPDKDWNETWEKEGFEPVRIGHHQEIIIHDTLHPTDGTAEYDICINPQLAFGTGTHETTGMLLELLLHDDLKGKTVLDMGCGTGILGIFCHLKGAVAVTAIDVDEWSVGNATANARLNGIRSGFTTLQGDADSLKGTENYDTAIANINRNILIRDMPRYAAAMKPHGASLFLSGFYAEDIPQLLRKAAPLGFTETERKECHNWACLKLER